MWYNLGAHRIPFGLGCDGGGRTVNVRPVLTGGVGKCGLERRGRGVEDETQSRSKGYGRLSRGMEGQLRMTGGHPMGPGCPVRA